MLFILFYIEMMDMNHKSMGMLYLVTGMVFGWVGFVLSVFISIEMVNEGLGMNSQVKFLYEYNNWMSMHGLMMLFMFVMPIAIGGYGNYLLPMLIGSNELVMPSLNGVSYYLLGYAGFLLLGAGLVFSKYFACGWTFYAPLSTSDIDNIGMSGDYAMFSLHMLGLSSGLGAVNFMSTMKECSHYGLYFMSLNLYVWAIVVTSFLLVCALPMLAMGLTGLILDSNLSTNIYDGDIYGDPMLYMHLFWFFGHPEVYMIIIPIFGLISLFITNWISKEIWGSEGMIYCMWSMGIIGFFVWAHHMYSMGLDVDSSAYFTAATAVISMPTSVKMFSYLCSFMGSGAGFGVSSIMSFWGFLMCFLFGGFTGLMLSSAVFGPMLHDTSFVVAHFHVVLALSAVFGMMFAWFSSVSVMFSINVYEGKGMMFMISFIIGANLVFGTLHMVGLNGLSSSIPEMYDSVYEWMSVGQSGFLFIMMSLIIMISTFYSDWMYINYNKFEFFNFSLFFLHLNSMYVYMSSLMYIINEEDMVYMLWMSMEYLDNMYIMWLFLFIYLNYSNWIYMSYWIMIMVFIMITHLLMTGMEYIEKNIWFWLMFGAFYTILTPFIASMYDLLYNMIISSYMMIYQPMKMFINKISFINEMNMLFMLKSYYSFCNYFYQCLYFGMRLWVVLILHAFCLNSIAELYTYLVDIHYIFTLLWLGFGLMSEFYVILQLIIYINLSLLFINSLNMYFMVTFTSMDILSSSYFMIIMLMLIIISDIIIKWFNYMMIYYLIIKFDITLYQY